MAKTQNITIRLKEDEFIFFESVAAQKGLNRTQMVKNAVIAYDKVGNTEPKVVEEASNLSVADRAEKALGTISNFSHPLLGIALEERITVKDINGNTVAVLHDLKSILDFTQKQLGI